MPWYNRLTLCELCGMRFDDDDHKDDHLNSCPKLPTFHEIESFGSELSGEYHSTPLMMTVRVNVTLSGSPAEFLEPFTPLSAGPTWNNVERV